MGPYNVTLGDENAITAEKMSGHTRGHGSFNADVIFLGGQKYVALLRFSVPHLRFSVPACWPRSPADWANSATTAR